MNAWAEEITTPSGEKEKRMMIPFMPVFMDRPAVSAMTRNILRLSVQLMTIIREVSGVLASP